MMSNRVLRAVPSGAAFGGRIWWSAAIYLYLGDQFGFTGAAADYRKRSRNEKVEYEVWLLAAGKIFGNHY